MRLFLTYVLDDDVSRLLYLDADTIVDGPLDALSQLDMEGHPVAMALDSLVRIHKKRLGFSRDDYYYNSGVMLFSMEEWRKTTVFNPKLRFQSRTYWSAAPFEHP